MERKTSSQLSRKKRKSPTVTAEVARVLEDIELANSVPVDYEFVDPNLYSWNTLRDFNNPKGLAERRRLIMNEIVANLPRRDFPIFHEAIVDRSRGNADKFFEGYEALRDLRGFLRAIIQAKLTNEDNVKNVVWRPQSLTMTIREGVLEAVLPSWIKDYVGVQVARVKECAVCKKIFWAFKFDVAYCRSGKCGNKFNVDKFRGKEYTERYKLNRIQKEQRKERDDLQKRPFLHGEVSLAGKGYPQVYPSHKR